MLGSDNLIIAFEGNVFTGKTTLIAEVSGKTGYRILPEHSDVVKLPSSSSAWDIQASYFAAEVARSRLIDKRHPSLLDRSVLSLCAHAFAVRQLGYASFGQHFTAALAGIIQDRTVIIPTHFVHVQCSHDIRLKRHLYNCSSPNPKNTDHTLLNRDYCHLFDQYVSACINYFPRTVFSTEQSVAACLDIIIAFINSIPINRVNIQESYFFDVLMEAQYHT